MRYRHRKAQCLNDPTLTDFLVDQARVSEHVTALILLLVKKGLIAGPEYEAALQEVVSARVLDADDRQGGARSLTGT